MKSSDAGWEPCGVTQAHSCPRPGGPCCNGVAVGVCTAPATERTNWNRIRTTFSLHISEAEHLYLPIRRCCFCWLVLLSLSRVCPELTLQFSLPALGPQSKLDCLEGSSASRMDWSSEQGLSSGTYLADLCILHYVYYCSLSSLFFVVTSNMVCMSCSSIFDGSS